MGTLDDKKAEYSNGDVIEAVRKVTKKSVEENTQIVQSKKGNDVDISDLWLPEKEINFKLKYNCYSMGGDLEYTREKELVAKERRNLV